MPSALYICYFGVNEPLVQTQVIPYLRELVKGGHEMSLLTFEPGEVDEASVRESLAADGIEWHWLRYHKRPSVPATLFDILTGARFVHNLHRKKNFSILHCRVHHPLAMAVLAMMLRRPRPKLLFDIRGFFPEEYVDAGVWKRNGILFKSVKWVEKLLMSRADGFVVLTQKARSILFPEIESPPEEGGTDRRGRPVEVVPCCVDLKNRFAGDRRSLRTERRRQLGISNRFVVLHLGALGGLYMVNEIGDLLAASREAEPSTYALFLTQSSPNLIEPVLKERGFANDDYYIQRVSPSEIEGYLYASDAALSIVQATYATASRSPTKIPEYLAAGLPMIVNPGVGDVDSLIVSARVGSVLTDFSTEAYMNALSELKGIDATPSRLRSIAYENFDLETVGGVRYRRLYESLLG